MMMILILNMLSRLVTAASWDPSTMVLLRVAKNQGISRAFLMDAAQDENNAISNVIFIERSLESCLHVYANPGKNPQPHDLTEKQFQDLQKLAEVDKLVPDAYFLIQLTNDEAYRRTVKRDRECEQGVDKGFICHMNEKNTDVFNNNPKIPPSKVHIFDGMMTPDEVSKAMHEKACEVAARSSRTVIIAVEAGVGAGKSTALGNLEQNYGYHVIPEPVDTVYAPPLIVLFQAFKDGSHDLARAAKLRMQTTVVRWYQKVYRTLHLARSWGEVECGLEMYCASKKLLG